MYNSCIVKIKCWVRIAAIAQDFHFYKYVKMEDSIMSCKSKLSCDRCGNEITKNNFQRHYSKCDGPKASSPYKGNRGGWNRGLTKEENSSLAKASQTLKTRIAKGDYVPKGTPHTEEFKIRQAELAHKRGLGGHTSKRQIYYKSKDGTEVYLQSSYEILFATILDNLNVPWSRPDPLIYKGGDGKMHRYYPDFLVGSVYIDTKNDYLAVTDLPKINAVREQHGIDLRVVTKDQINEEFIALLV